MQYLRQLLAGRNYKGASSYAESLLKNQELTAEVMIEIYSSLLTARIGLGEYHGAIAIGEVTLDVAEKNHLWEQFGQASIDLGAVYAMLERYEDAADVLFGYLNHWHVQIAENDYQRMGWYNLGSIYTQLQQGKEASQAFRNALSMADKFGDHRIANVIRQGLLDTLIKSGELEEVPRMLAVSCKYLRMNSDLPNFEQTWLFNLRLRADYALLTRRYSRARLLALKGLMLAEADLEHKFLFHIILSTTFRATGYAVQAVGHSLAARYYAGILRRKDKEKEAEAIIYAVAVEMPGILQEVDRHYLHSVGGNSIQSLQNERSE